MLAKTSRSMSPTTPGIKALTFACNQNSDTGTVRPLVSRGMLPPYIHIYVTFGPTRLAPEHAPAQHQQQPIGLSPATALADSASQACCWSGLQNWSLGGMAGVPLACLEPQCTCPWARKEPVQDVLHIKETVATLLGQDRGEGGWEEGVARSLTPQAENLCGGRRGGRGLAKPLLAYV